MNWFTDIFRTIYRQIVGILFDISHFVQNASGVIYSAMRSLADVKERRIITGSGSTRNVLSASNFVNPFFWLIQFFQWILRYLTSRSPVPGVQGMPALVCGLCMIFCGTLLTPSLSERIAQARANLELSVQRGKLEQADFYSRQLCFMAPNDASLLFERAKLFEKTDRIEQTRETMVQLANERKYVPAMEWICDDCLKYLKESQIPDEKIEIQLVLGLTSILQIQPENLKANAMLGGYYVRQGLFSRAVPLLKKAIELSPSPNPATYYTLAVAQRNLGLLEDCRVNATISADVFLERNARQPYSVESSMELLRSMILAQREREAVLMIYQALPKRSVQEAKELNWLLGEVYAQWCQRLRIQKYRTAEDLALALDAIYKGISVAPNNPFVIEEMVQISCVTDVDDRVLQQQLEVALNAGVSPGLVHFILGTRLLLAGENNAHEALRHLELAMEHDKSLPGLLNNVADAMVESNSNDTDRALMLVDQAIAMLPNQPYFFDTRGKIFLKKNDPQKAIADLEKALAAPELRGQVHAELAAAYLAMKDQKNYEFHSSMAENYRGQQVQSVGTPVKAVGQ